MKQMELLKSRSNKVKTGDIAHLLFNIALPVTIFLMVGFWELYNLAVIVMLLSKWRIFAVQPRFWWANLRANMIDIIVGLSIIGLMFQANESLIFQGFWGLFYLVWLVYIKPQSSQKMVAIQAALGQFLGITALFWFSDSLVDLVIIAGAWFIAFISARHFISVHEEETTTLLSLMWGLFAVQLAWLLNRWVIVYDVFGVLFIPQIAIILLIIGFGIAHLYDDAKQGTLTSKQIQYVIGFGGVLLFLVLTIFSRWSGVV